MSRHQKPRRPGGHAPPSSPLPAPLSPHAESRNGATPPAALTNELAELRSLVEETRRDVNARLDALAQAMERLAPAAPRGQPAPPTAPSPNGATPAANAPGLPGDAATRTHGPMVRVSDEVYVPRLGGTYTVVEVQAGGAAFKVQAGNMRVQVRRDEAWALDDGPPGKPPPSKAPERPLYLDAHIPEIDLHGFREREAIVTLELFLDHAVASRTPRVRIIHGKGDGILRAAVRRELKRNPLVRQVDFGPHFQGDDGVTLAELDV